MTSDDHIGRIERIEAHAAHNEAALDDLSETVQAQWAEIERLKREVGKLTRTLAALMQQDGEADVPIQKPPHY